jgi:hypothetical protein
MGYCAQLSISCFGSRFTKNPISALQKWKKHISWDEKKIGLVVFLAIARSTRVSDVALF